MKDNLNLSIYPSKAICTLKFTQHLDPNGVIPKYNLQYLKYFLGINRKVAAYDALGDILVLEILLTKMKGDTDSDMTEDKMIQISNDPVLLIRIYFGTHNGQLFKNIPQDHLQWLSGQYDFDKNIRYTVKYYLI